MFPDSNKKPTQRSTDRSERNVKFAGESREERNNRRNREDRPPTAPADFNRFVCRGIPLLKPISCLHNFI
jgi:hypothetical protein